MADLGKTSSGIQPNVAGLLAYTLGLVSGIIFLVIEKENKFVRFHAVQAIWLSVSLTVAGIVLGLLPAVGVALGVLINLAGLALWIICMIKAYQGQLFRIPVVGDLASKQVGT